MAIADDITVAYDRAYSTDPESAFGGIIAFNRELDDHTARTIIERQGRIEALRVDVPGAGLA